MNEVKECKPVANREWTGLYKIHIFKDNIMRISNILTLLQKQV